MSRAAILLSLRAIRPLFAVPKQAFNVAAYAIGSIASFWVIERVGATFL